MKLFIHSITLSVLLQVAAGYPVSDTTLIKKLKLRKQNTLSHSFSKRDVSTLNKLNQIGYFHGSGYYSEVQVGEPAQLFNVIFDTGSSDFWVVSTNCTTKEFCQTHKQFDPTSSKSYSKHDESDSIRIRYGTGSIHARTGHDTLRIGSMTLRNQFVSDATSISAEFKDLPIDGIMGLGLPKLSKTKGRKLTLIESMVEQKIIDKAIFSIYTQPAGGEIDFGGTDPARYTGNIMYAPITDDIYWMTNMNQSSFGGYKTGPRKLIHDTGTTLLIVTPEDAKEFHSRIKGSQANSDGSYNVPCHMKGKSPPLILTVHGHQLSIPSEDYILLSSSDNEYMCLSGISGQSIHKPNHWILGGVFLKTYYTVFDYQQKRMGFAKSVTDPSLSIEKYDME